MNPERMKVLEMLAAGKITPDEAERIIEKLAAIAPPPDDAPAQKPPGSLKYLRVVLHENDGERVNIRVPLALVRTGLKLSTMLPKHASEELSRKGIDISQLCGLQGEELIDALRELQVDVDSDDGEQVRIFCE
jgi:hypothetical protein